jgi:hypothetical protein
VRRTVKANIQRYWKISPPPFTPDLEKTKYLPILFEGKHISEREKKMMENVKKGREILKIEGK